MLEGQVLVVVLVFLDQKLYQLCLPEWGEENICMCIGSVEEQFEQSRE